MCPNTIEISQAYEADFKFREVLKELKNKYYNFIFKSVMKEVIFYVHIVKVIIYRQFVNEEFALNLSQEEEYKRCVKTVEENLKSKEYTYFRYNNQLDQPEIIGPISKRRYIMATEPFEKNIKILLEEIKNGKEHSVMCRVMNFMRFPSSAFTVYPILYILSLEVAFMIEQLNNKALNNETREYILKITKKFLDSFDAYSYDRIRTKENGDFIKFTKYQILFNRNYIINAYEPFSN